MQIAPKPSRARPVMTATELPATNPTATTMAPRHNARMLAIGTQVGRPNLSRRQPMSQSMEALSGSDAQPSADARRCRIGMKLIRLGVATVTLLFAAVFGVPAVVGMFDYANCRGEISAYQGHDRTLLALACNYDLWPALLAAGLTLAFGVT